VEQRDIKMNVQGRKFPFCPEKRKYIRLGKNPSERIRQNEKMFCRNYIFIKEK
jgi:hypothetical protein